MSFAAIKRSINNDNNEHETDEYNIRLFDKREDAANYLIESYEFEYDQDISVCRSLILSFFTSTETNEDALFQWEWKRRGNFRTYKIVPIREDGKIEFYAQTKNLFKLKHFDNGNVEIVRKKSI